MKTKHNVFIPLMVMLVFSFGVSGAVYAQSAGGAWPSADRYPVTFPKPAGKTLADVSIHESEDEPGYYLFTFTCLRMSEAEAEKYAASLPKSPYTWKGKKYQCQVDQIYPNGANAEFAIGIFLAN